MRKKFNVFEESQHIMENQISTLENQVVELTRAKHELQDANNTYKNEFSGTISKEEAIKLNHKIVELQEVVSSLEADSRKYKELYDTAMKQYAMLENQIHRHTKENESLKSTLLELQSLNDSNQVIGRLHRDQLLSQINEASALKKFEQSQSDIVKLSVKENKLNKMLYEKIEQLVQTREEYRNKMREYQQKIVELSHSQKYLDQIESLMSTSQQLELAKINVEQQYQVLRQENNELQVQLQETQIKWAETESVLKSSIISKDNLEWRDQAIQFKVDHMKLTRENTILKEDVAHLEKTKQGLESALRRVELDLVRVQQANEKKIGLLSEQIKHLEDQSLDRERDKDMALLLQRERVAISTTQESPLTVSQRLEEALRKLEDDEKLIAELNLKCVQLSNQLEELQKTSADRDALILRKEMENQNLQSQLNVMPKQSTQATEDYLHKNIHLDYQILDNLYRASQDEVDRLNRMLEKKEESIANYQNILNTYRQNFEVEMEKANGEITRLNELLYKESASKIYAMKKDLENSELKTPAPTTGLDDLSISVKQMDHLLLEREVQIRELTLQLNNSKKDLLQTKDLIVTKQQEFDALLANYQAQLQDRDAHIQELQKSKGDLEHALQLVERDFTNANNNFKLQLEEMHGKADEEQMPALQEEVEKLQLELKTLKSKKLDDTFSDPGAADDTNKPSSNVVKRLKIQLSSKEKQIKNLEDAIALLKQEVLDAYERGAQRGKDTSSEVTIQELNGRISSMEVDLKSLSQSKQKIQKELEQSRANLDAVTVQQQSQTQKYEALTNKLSTDLKKAQKVIQNLRARVEKLTSENETAKEHENKVQELIANYEKKIRLLSDKVQQDQVATPRTKTLQRRPSYDNISRESGKPKEQSHQTQLQLSEKNAALLEKDKEIFGLRTQIYDLQMHLDTQQKVIEVDNKIELQKLQTENKQLQEQLHVSELLVSQHEFGEEVNTRKGQINLKKLQEELLQCQREKQELENTSLAKEAKSMDLLFEKEHEVIKNSTLRSRIQELEEELKSIKENREPSKVVATPSLPANKESEYLLVIEDLKKMIEKLKKDNTRTKKSAAPNPKLNELMQENQELKKTLEDFETNLPDNRSTYELAQDNRQLKETIMKQKRVVEEFSQENASIQNQLMQQASKYDLQIQKLTKEKAKMEGRIFPNCYRLQT
jgi:hypothetical protein